VWPAIFVAALLVLHLISRKEESPALARIPGPRTAEVGKFCITLPSPPKDESVWELTIRNNSKHRVWLYMTRWSHHPSATPIASPGIRILANDEIVVPWSDVMNYNWEMNFRSEDGSTLARITQSDMRLVDAVDARWSKEPKNGEEKGDKSEP